MAKSRASTGGEPTFVEAARRAQMIEAAIHVVAQNGFASASVSEIAARAQVSRGLVSYHFADKHQLVALIVEKIYATAAEVMLPAVAAAQGARAKLVAYTRSNGEFIIRYPHYAAAQLEIWTSYRSSDGRRLDQLIADAGPPPKELEGLNPAHLLAVGIDAAELRAVPVASTAVALRQAIDGAVLCVSRDPSFDVSGYLDDVIDLFDRALRPDSARSSRGQKGS
jgi:TetR/AcrR family transcriptional regulator, fatty acid metabolism regulator protein